MSPLETIAISKSAVFDLCPGVNGGKPLVGKIADSFAPRDWNWEALEGLIGEKIVRPLVEIPDSGKFERDYRAYEKEMKFSDFVSLAKSSPLKPCYLAYLRPRDIHPILHQEADFGFLKLSNDHETDTRVWMGSVGTNSGLHTDLKDNIFVQVHGRKRLFLAPPEHTSYVYPQVDNIVNSDVRFPNPDMARFPKLSRADVYHCIVDPGEAVYIPKGWWHCLVSLEDSISVNHWFGSPISDGEYIKMIFQQGPRHVGRAVFDLIAYGILKLTPRNDFFYTPPPNGARLYSYIRHGNFSRDNDPHLEK
jgi:hypothetical protein